RLLFTFQPELFDSPRVALDKTLNRGGEGLASRRCDLRRGKLVEFSRLGRLRYGGRPRFKCDRVSDAEPGANRPARSLRGRNVKKISQGRSIVSRRRSRPEVFRHQIW